MDEKVVDTVITVGNAVTLGSDILHNLVGRDISGKIGTMSLTNGVRTGLLVERMKFYVEKMEVK